MKKHIEAVEVRRVRGEALKLTDGGLRAAVKTVEYLGADSILACAVGSQTLSVRAPGRVELPAGAPVHLVFNKDAIHVFDLQRGGERA